MSKLRTFLLTLVTLYACSKAPAQAPSPPPARFPSPADITAQLTRIVVVGDDWRLDADPFYGMSLAEHGRNTFSGSDRLVTGGTGAAFRYLLSDLSVGVTRADCMLDGKRYPLSATLDRVGQPQRIGCGFEPWDGRARAAVKIADACAPLGSNAQRITLFEVRGDGAMFLRLRGNAGGVDCTIANDQLTSAPRDEATHYGGEGELDLIRSSRTPPDDPCIASNTTTDADGNLVGWLVPKDDKCRTQPLQP